MEIKRKSFQGVCNIIRFNWHFYLIAGIVLFLLFFSYQYLPKSFQLWVLWLSSMAILIISISIIVSYLVYDRSNLYQLNWLTNANGKMVLNVNAGFDETSALLKRKFPEINLTVCDFYNPKKHTEISIKRARIAYPPFENTVQISTQRLPFSDNYFDSTLAILSAHEVRNEKERMDFFTELARVTKPTGQIFVTEHLRDFANFLAYTIGFFHFHSKSSWLQTFAQANLSVKQEVKTTPFISTFILENNGSTS